MEVGGTSLVKLLASTNKPTRDKALRTILKTWLPSQSELSDDDMKKLWKGLFYCVWHSDKLPVQTELINRICSILPALPVSLSVDYFSVFFLTMRREWSGIDGLRLDKFYLLIRRFLHFSFDLLKKECWDLEVCGNLVRVLEERTFFADDKFQGNGVNYHVASVFLEELKPFLPLKADVLEVLFAPFVSVIGKVPDKVLIRKIKTNLFDVFLRSGKVLLEKKKLSVDGGNDDDGVAVLGPIGLVMGWSTKFFELGSSPDCCQGNRKMLFGLHEEFLKLERELASSGNEISIPDIVVNEDDEEVPTLVPITCEIDMNEEGGNGANGSGGKLLKKRKNNKKTSDGKKVKEKKKKKKNVSTIESENKDIVMAIGKNTNDEDTLNEFVTSNLHMQFEKVAAESGLGNDVGESCELLPKTITANGTVTKKRKRSKSLEGRNSQNSEPATQKDTGGTSTKSGEKSAKKVRFSMKNNLVWKPHSPLPSQDLRLPPSATPRGSALKKGLSPGPIREMPQEAKKRRAKSLKKGRKVMKSLYGVKRPKKLKPLSA